MTMVCFCLDGVLFDDALLGVAATIRCMVEPNMTSAIVLTKEWSTFTGEASLNQ